MDTDRRAVLYDLAGPATYATSPRQLRAAVWAHDLECYMVRYLPHQWEDALLAIDSWPLSEDDRHMASKQVLSNAMHDGYRREPSLWQRGWAWLVWKQRPLKCTGEKR